VVRFIEYHDQIRSIFEPGFCEIVILGVPIYNSRSAPTLCYQNLQCLDSGNKWIYEGMVKCRNRLGQFLTKENCLACHRACAPLAVVLDRLRPPA
jgi:hypothetical protein